MLITELPGALQAARPDAVRPEHLPALPAWWPLPDPEHPQTPGERSAARHARAVTEARRGPFDGTRVAVHCPNGRPPGLLPMLDGGVMYELDEAQSTPDWLVYRYSPARSPLHRSIMGSVEEGFREAGPGYTEAARTDEAQHQGITVERTS